MYCFCSVAYSLCSIFKNPCWRVLQKELNLFFLPLHMTATEVFKKLRLDPTKALLIVHAPPEFSSLLAGISYDTQFDEGKEGSYDFVQVFATHQSDLEKRCVEVGKAGKYDGLFWACYPKGTGKIKSDIKRETVWKALELIGLQTVTQIAIDKTWSALRARPVERVGK